MNCVSKAKFTKSLNRVNDSVDQCLVCAAPTIGFHFGVICCPPCKMFFKRNAESKQVGSMEHERNDEFVFVFKMPLACTLANRCNINPTSRRTCRFCRLNKCFAIGMQVERFHASHPKNHRKKQVSLFGIFSKLNDLFLFSSIRLIY